MYLVDNVVASKKSPQKNVFHIASKKIKKKQFGVRIRGRGTRSPLGAGTVPLIESPSGIGAGSGIYNRFRVRGRDG